MGRRPLTNAAKSFIGPSREGRLLAFRPLPHCATPTALSFRTLGPWRMPAHERQPAALLLSSCSMESWCTLVVHGSTTSTLQHDGTTACTTRSIVQDDINGSLAMPCAFLARGAYGLHGAEAASQTVDSRVRHFGTVDMFLVMKHDCACALCGA